MLWARFLSVREAFWANGVFVFAPLSVFYGQAVMLEMVFLSVCLAFVLAVLRYSEKPTMLQFGVKLVVLDNIGRSDNEFDPSSLKLPFGHTVEGMLSVNRSLIHYNQKEAAGGRDG